MSTDLLLLGIDALDPIFVERNLSRLPHLASLMERSAWGRMRSTIPPVTGVAWPTAMSGMNPGKTGVLTFPEGDFTTTHVVLDSRHVQVPRIWNVLSHLGRRVAVVGVPKAYPVEEVNGMMVGGFMTPSAAVAFTYPPELQADIVARGYDPSMDLGFEKYGKAGFLRALYHKSEIKFQQTVEWLRAEKWDCFMTVLSESDWVQHFLVRPEKNPEYHNNQELLLEYFAFMDRYIGELVASAGPDAYILIVSDHGFGRVVSHNVHVNRWLLDQGYLVLKNSRAVSLRHQLGSHIRSGARPPGWNVIKRCLPVIKRCLPMKIRQAGRALMQASADDIDWEKTVAHYHTKYNSVGCIRVWRERGASESAYQRVRTDIYAGIAALHDPRTGARLVDKVYLREELYSGPYVEREPDIIFLFADGYGGVDLLARSLVVDIPEGAERVGHRFEGIWLLSGSDVHIGTRLDLDLQDVAPIVYHLLNAPMPREMDGRIPVEMFIDGSLLRERSPVYLTEDLEPRKFVGVEADSNDDSIVDRLRALGYVE